MLNRERGRVWLTEKLDAGSRGLVTTLILIASMVAFVGDAKAQNQARQETVLQDGQVRDVILALATLIEANYVDAKRGQQIASELRKRLGSGEYADKKSPVALASDLTLLLEPYDRHFNVVWHPPGSGGVVAGTHLPLTEDEEREWLEYMKRENFGFSRVEILSGNIGYLDLRFFADADGSETAIAAMRFLSNTDAVIVDLRQNGGGEPAMVQLLVSYFLGPQRIHFNSLYWRAGDRTDQYWTLPHVEGSRILEAPVYILTSARTGSAAEEFAYNLQAQKRATVVGEVTAGGANPGEGFIIGHGFSAFISTGRAINPVTGTNWEQVGVKPEVGVPSIDAFDVAYAASIRWIIEDQGPENVSLGLKWALEALELKRAPVELSPSDLNEYAGVYGDRKIRFEGDHMTYQRGKRAVFRMVPLGNNRFLTIGKDDFRLRFERDSNGTITGLTDLWSGGHTEWNRRAES